MCAWSHINLWQSPSDDGVGRSMGAIMKVAASQEHFSHGHFQQQSRRSAVVAGVGAALIASALTFALMVNGSAPVAAPDQAAAATTQCQVIPRKLLVSTETGSGTVRLRAGSYLSPAISLKNTPQEVVFPEARPTVGFVDEVVTIEGSAANVVISSSLTDFKKVLDVSGVAVFNLRWIPIKTC
jgi:hypothetical protein